MASSTKKRQKYQYKKRRNRSQGGGGGGGSAPASSELPAIDFSTLPADLDAEAIEELIAELPPYKKRTKPKTTSYYDLQEQNVADLLDVAKKEKVAPDSRKRREVIWAIAKTRLEGHIPVTAKGTLEVTREGPAFLRTPFSDYMPSLEDVCVPPSVIEKHTLVPGMWIEGLVRVPREGEKTLALVEVTTIDGAKPKELENRTPFKELVPLYPEQRILLEGTMDNPLEMRIVDLITPIGRGQRGLIVAPPRTGKTVLLQMLARSIVENASDTRLIVLLIDERPEEVTDFRRMLAESDAEVVSSTFDEPAWRHIHVADMVIKQARSRVEAGEDVVILLDSITRLARACNVEAPSNGKLLSGGMEASALQFPKQFFGAARNIEDGGSLTILGTALIETGSKMDELIFEEFKGTGNMELVLERRLSDRRIYPAIDINRPARVRKNSIRSKRWRPSSRRFSSTESGSPDHDSRADSPGASGSSIAT
ncbi:MAG: transcription termination factor Rho [Planctomycetota bacterium]